MTWTTGRDGGFLAAEMEALATLAVLMAAPLEVLVVRQMAATLLNTYLGLRSGRQVLAGLVKRGDGETIHAVIWLSDLRGFAALSEKLPRDDLIALLNVHFERLSGPIRAFGGEVLKFMGDGLLAIFPIGEAGQGATPATAAVRAARSAITSMRQLNEGRRADRKPQLRFGVALHVGDVHYGNIGSPDRLDFTAIGPAVNLASRLERLCKRLRCPVLMSGDFAGLWGDEAVALGRRKLRGLAEPVDLYTLPELAPIAPAGRA
jgi:adenylate cyclase